MDSFDFDGRLWIDGDNNEEIIDALYKFPEEKLKVTIITTEDNKPKLENSIRNLGAWGVMALENKSTVVSTYHDNNGMLYIKYIGKIVAEKFHKKNALDVFEELVNCHVERLLSKKGS